MKKATIFVFIVLFFPSSVLAQSITTGNSSASTTVETRTNGSEVQTYIEVEANGERKVINSNQPGTHSVSVESNSNGSNSSANVVSETSTPSPTNTEVVKKKVSKKVKQAKQNIQVLFEKLSEFITRLFNLK